MNNPKNFEEEQKSINLKDEIVRYFTFWPWFLLSIIITSALGFIYLRYAEYQYQAIAKIEILDKAQDSEMSLPTAMTVFNRSMINLENEIGVLGSYSLHSKVVKKLNSNVKFYTKGKIKTTENHKSQWIKDLNLKFNIDFDTVYNPLIYNIKIMGGKLKIDLNDSDDNLLDSYLFDTLTTFNQNHNLPFDISINDSHIKNDLDKVLKIFPLESTIDNYRSITQITKVGKDSDHLLTSIIHPNVIIAEDYLNALLFEFDNDGIVDRQLEYKRTMEFVDSRSEFLTKELDQIELRKQNFKEKNKLTDIKADANLNVTQQYNYNSELFSAQSQKDLTILLKETLVNEFELIPVNIGLDSSSINSLISEYNLLLKERDRSLLSAGRNNNYVKNIEKKLNDYFKNIKQSIENYLVSLNKTIQNLELKEKEFANIYKNIPENEKILRSIERELNVKEALFLLLLQKREEASINFAVVKPSIKIIDRARANFNPVSPIKEIVYLGSAISGILIPFLSLYILFLLDTKIHTRKQLSNLLPNIPIIGEIPHIDDIEKLNKIISKVSREAIAESIRMVIANLNFVLFNKANERNNLILVTSSVKGEGKTIISSNIASLLSYKYKVLLVGADLRNPQIHRYLNIDKNVTGLSDYLYKNNVNWKNYLIKHEGLDILLSGTIPPNPTELLGSKKFKSFLEDAKQKYDYIVIDSAPCLIVSDTFEISKYVDTTLYVVRANFSDIKLTDFISENQKEGKLSNLNIVLNGLGSSSAYGYKYGYQYGYKYGYKYSYNYGYGYGYSEDKKKNR